MIKPKKMRRAGHVARMEEKRNAHRILAEKPEGKSPLERPKRKWADITKMDRREIEWCSMDRTDLAQGRQHGGIL
jgi:hypothetical protein